MNPLSTFKKAKSKIRRQRYPLKNIASNINPKIFMKLGIISDIHDKVDILRKALDILQKQTCGLVIFDWRTGPMSGEDFLKTMRGNEKLKDTPFVVVSAESNEELTDVMRNAGAADFIAKPFTKATLRKRMTTLFGSF